MPNKKHAQEWLELAKHNLDAAEHLFQVNHYTDVIGIELHQAIEKTIKAIYALHNTKIIKTHNLVRLADNCNLPSIMSLEYDMLEIISDYYAESRYPGPKYDMPAHEEIQDVLAYSKNIYTTIRDYINTY